MKAFHLCPATFSLDKDSRCLNSLEHPNISALDALETDGEVRFFKTVAASIYLNNLIKRELIQEGVLPYTFHSFHWQEVSSDWGIYCFLLPVLLFSFTTVVLISCFLGSCTDGGCVNGACCWKKMPEGQKKKGLKAWMDYRSSPLLPKSLKYFLLNTQPEKRYLLA